MKATQWITPLARVWFFALLYWSMRLCSTAQVVSSSLFSCEANSPSSVGPPTLALRISSNFCTIAGESITVLEGHGAQEASGRSLSRSIRSKTAHLWMPWIWLGCYHWNSWKRLSLPANRHFAEAPVHLSRPCGASGAFCSSRPHKQSNTGQRHSTLARCIPSWALWWTLPAVRDHWMRTRRFWFGQCRFRRHFDCPCAEYSIRSARWPVGCICWIPPVMVIRPALDKRKMSDEN